MGTSNRRHRKEAGSRKRQKQKVERSLTRRALDVLNAQRGKPMTIAELTKAMGINADERRRVTAGISSSMYKKAQAGAIARVAKFGPLGGYGYVWPIREPSRQEVKEAILSVLAEAIVWREYKYVNEQTSRIIFDRDDYECVADAATVELWREGLIDLRQPWTSFFDGMTLAERRKVDPALGSSELKLTSSGFFKERVRRHGFEEVS